MAFQFPPRVAACFILAFGQVPNTNSIDQGRDHYYPRFWVSQFKPARSTKIRDTDYLFNNWTKCGTVHSFFSYLLPSRLAF